MARHLLWGDDGRIPLQEWVEVNQTSVASSQYSHQLLILYTYRNQPRRPFLRPEPLAQHHQGQGRSPQLLHLAEIGPFDEHLALAAPASSNTGPDTPCSPPLQAPYRLGPVRGHSCLHVATSVLPASFIGAYPRVSCRQNGRKACRE